MRIYSSLVLIVTIGAVAGCTSTKVYDPSDSSDRDAVEQKTWVQIELVDGTDFAGNVTRVDVDTLFLASQHQDPLALSEVAKVSSKEFSVVKTVALMVPVSLVFAALIVCANDCEPG